MSKPETPSRKLRAAIANEARMNVKAWLRVHADACRTQDTDLRRKAVARIAFWSDEVLSHD